MSRAIMIWVTVPSEEVGVSIVERLVEERLVACGNLVPGLRSIYRWEGKVERSQEALLILKTLADRFDAVRERIVELHPYDCPEVLRTEVEDGHPPYLQWIADSVTDGG